MENVSEERWSWLGEPDVKRETAIERAREVAQREGWLWLEPVEAWRERYHAGERRSTWTVVSNAAARGFNSCVKIDDRTGAVIDAKFYTETAEMTREEAISRARRIAEGEKWTWFEPVGARLQRSGPFGLWGRKEWVVRSNDGARGCNVWVRFDAVTGDVVTKSFVPR